ncbi:mannose-6-phosphate isomerase, class I [Actinospica sp. MGRD01-02]|uniref:mannose-6-phosphate isomerase n=1 Tax=Actinospica acidithermotolerans TaxID=2828514 RepID=A0A941E9Z0_9ACTN|nr:mannose-6-phosphate isomerase, class I [Actinospica acidithermotolerans]MBR7825249.1 mannose-6-phosphate isomerase, class I [Actinospica acidithermotolerans]
MDLLGNTVQPYAWGSRTAIAELLGEPSPSAGPQAELWMGAHPSAPSVLTRDGVTGTLTAAIAANPSLELGVRVAARFGGRLPFLLKVLAAEKALSMQLHPTREQAEAGFAREERSGVPRNARERVYVDDWPKPEILCALTPFEVLAGLRPAEQAAEALEGLGVPELKELVGALRATPTPRGVADALTHLLTWPADSREALAAKVVDAAAVESGKGGPYAAAYDAIVRVSADHPRDIGLVCSLLMNHRVVEPGEALYMDAGGVHAYISGVGVELMANSDNVIRAGLTPKHIDVPELTRVLVPEVEVPVITAVQTAPGVEVFDTPAPEFRLSRLTLAEGATLTVPGDGGPRVLFCAAGEASVSCGTEPDGHFVLARGQSCFLSAADSNVLLTGSGRFFLAEAGI